MDEAARWVMVSALITDQPVLTVILQGQKSSSAYTNRLGYPRVRIFNILLKCKRPASGNDTLNIPADVWLERESVYKVRNKDVAEAMLLDLVANCQGASECCNPDSLNALQLQASPKHFESIVLARPKEGVFPECGATLRLLRSYARHNCAFLLYLVRQILPCRGNSQGSLQTELKRNKVHLLLARPQGKF